MPVLILHGVLYISHGGFELSTRFYVLKSQFSAYKWSFTGSVWIYTCFSLAYFSKHLPQSLTVKTDCFVKLSVYIVYLYIFVISAIITNIIKESRTTTQQHITTTSNTYNIAETIYTNYTGITGYIVSPACVRTCVCVCVRVFFMLCVCLRGCLRKNNNIQIFTNILHSHTHLVKLKLSKRLKVDPTVGAWKSTMNGSVISPCKR